MIKITELTELLNKYNEIVEYAIDNFYILKEQADNAEIVKYGTDSTGLGCLYPEIRKKICNGKYGRFLKKKPNAKNYTIYEFTNQMTPLRVKHIDEEKYLATSETYLFFSINNEIYAVPFMGESNNFYISNNCYMFAYKGEKLSQFSFFSNARINLMEFDYTNYPQICMTQHDFLRLKYNIQKDYQYKVYKFHYVEDDNGKIMNLIQASIIS